MITLDGIRYHRHGDASGNDWLSHANKRWQKRDGEDDHRGTYKEKLKFGGLFFDPFYVAIAPTGLISFQHVDELCIERSFLANGEFLGAKTDDKNRVVGTWLISQDGKGGSVAEIVFSNKQPHRPVEAVWRVWPRGSKKPTYETKLDLISTVACRWEANGDGIIVPTRYETTNYIPSTGDPYEEWSFDLEWKSTKGIVVTPRTAKELVELRVNAADWREDAQMMFKRRLAADLRSMERATRPTKGR